MVSTRFLSKEVNFEESNKDLLEELIFYGLSLGADFIEIFLENTDNLSLLAEEDYITSVSPSFGRGAGIRIFKDMKDGFVSTNDLSQEGLMSSIKQAAEMLDIDKVYANEGFNGLEGLRDFSEPKNSWLNQIPEINEIEKKLLDSTNYLKKDNKINVRKGSYSRNWQQVLIASSDGTFAKDIRLHQTVGLNVLM